MNRPVQIGEIPSATSQPSVGAFGSVVLLLQGGGALGAYQGGVYEALVEHGVEPNWLAGISIGAFNSAIIAGNPPKDRVSQLRAALGENFTILSGDDSLTLPFMSVGAHGVVSVASNVIPREVSQMVKLFATGKSSAAIRMHEKYYPLFKDLFIETNPTPVKAALAMMKLISEEYRLPLVPMNPKNWEALRTTLKRCNVLE